MRRRRRRAFVGRRVSAVRGDPTSGVRPSRRGLAASGRSCLPDARRRTRPDEESPPRRQATPKLRAADEPAPTPQGVAHDPPATSNGPEERRGSGEALLRRAASSQSRCRGCDEERSGRRRPAFAGARAQANPRTRLRAGAAVADARTDVIIQGAATSRATAAATRKRSRGRCDHPMRRDARRPTPLADSGGGVGTPPRRCASAPPPLAGGRFAAGRCGSEGGGDASGGAAAGDGAAQAQRRATAPGE